MRIAYTNRLVVLNGRVEAAAARLATAAAADDPALATDARQRRARASARLDASPLTDETANAVDARRAAGEPPVTPDPPALSPAAGASGGGWAQALRLEGMATQEVAAVEYANLLDLTDAEQEFAARLHESPRAVLSEVHAAVCRGLVTPETLGRPRTTEQAIHDGAQGRVVYLPPAPESLEERLDTLSGWLHGPSALVPAAVAAGVVHERLLEWQPFEAGNGRTARAAARLLLVARGVDVQGLAVPEEEHLADAAGYHAEVAATIRRRGALELWLERELTALVTQLERVVERLLDGDGAVLSEAARDAARDVPEGGTLTVREYGRRRGCSLWTAMNELSSLERAGLFREVRGSQGLRFRRTAAL